VIDQYVATHRQQVELFKAQNWMTDRRPRVGCDGRAHHFLGQAPHRTLGLAVRSTVSHVRSATTERCCDEGAAGRDDRRRPLGAGHLPDPRYRRHGGCLPGILKAPLNFRDLPLAADVVHAQPMFVVSEAEAAVAAAAAARAGASRW